MIASFIHELRGGHRFVYKDGHLDVPAGSGSKERVEDGKVEAVGAGGAAAREMAGNLGEDLSAKEADERQRCSFDAFIQRFTEASKDEKGRRKFAEWAGKQTDVELLRRAGVDAKTNGRDVLAKHVKLASEYLSRVEDKDGHFVFEVDFKGNELAEWKIGAGHLLPATVKAVKIYDAEGKVLTQYAVREIKDGRVGYFSESGAYIPVHSGYKIEVLEIQEITEPAVSTRVKEENDLYEKDERKLAVKENLEVFFRAKKLDIKIDDNYFASGIDELLDELESADAEWWQKYLDGKFVYNDFEALFAKAFSEQDLNFVANLCRLRDLQKSGQRGEKIPDEVFMSDFVRLKGDARFSDFKDGKLTDDQLYEFAKGKFEFGGSYSELVGDSKEAGSREPFELVDGKFWLRASVARVFLRAREYARTLVPSVELRLNSAHRGIGSQKGIFARALKKYGSAKAAQKWAALPGSSPHHTGGAVDVYAVVNGKGGVKHKNQKYLKTILPRFGFVNYSPEPWHWEIYTKRWRRITGSSGPIYTSRLEKIDASNASKYA